MDHRTAVSYGLALGVARFVVLAFAAVGFLAMHGVAATDPGGLHLSPINMAPSTSHPAPGVVEPTDVLAPTQVASAPVASAPVASAPVASAPAHGDGSNEHERAAACLLVLLGVVAAVAGQAVRTRLGTSGSAALRAVWRRCEPARAPPRPIFLSLCVFRL